MADKPHGGSMNKITFPVIITFLLLLLAPGPVKAQQPGAKYGADSMRCITNLSLYREFYRMKNYADALPFWRKVFFECPMASQNTFIEGARIISSKIAGATTEAARNAYTDTLMMVYDARVKYFGSEPKSREGMVRGRQALELSNYRPADTMTIYRLLRQSVGLEGTNCDPLVASAYFQSTENLVKSGRFVPDSLFNAYHLLSELADRKLLMEKGDTSATRTWKSLQQLLDTRTAPYAGCEELNRIYGPRFAEAPADTALLKKMTRMLERNHCDESELYYNAAVNLYNRAPGPRSAFQAARLYLGRGDLLKAEKAFAKAAAADDNELKALALFGMAAVNYQQKNYTSARSYAYQSLAINPADGKCYMLIGDMYAAGTPGCGSGEISTRAGYWAAVDKYVRAKTVDPSVTDEANRRIAVYSSNFPTRERLFFNDLKEGSVYNVGCWINESTIVRASK